MTKVTPFLMFDDQLEAAMEFYTATFPDSEVRNVARTGKDGPITSAEFVVGGQVFMGYNVWLDQGPVRPLVADCAETVHATHRRPGPPEGEGGDGGHDDDGQTRRGGP